MMTPRRSIRNRAFVFSFMVLSSSVAFGQDRAVRTDDPNVPGEEHALLQKLAGNWDVSLKIPVGGGTFIDGRSHCRAESVLDGRFLRLEYTSTFRGKPLTVVRYIGYDRHKSRFVEIQFESTHTDVLQSEGTASEDGKTITSRGTHVDMALNRPVPVRTVTTILHDDRFTLDMIYADLEGTDAKTVTLTHTRIPLE